DDSLSPLSRSSAAVWNWQAIALLVYVAGVFVLGFRCAVGWSVAARFVRTSATIGTAAKRSGAFTPLSSSGHPQLNPSRCDRDAPPTPARLIRPRETIVRESAQVFVPVTVGILRPTVVLPRGWREWPSTTLHAALAHEAVHAARRDPLINLLARLNRCLFWF